MQLFLIERAQIKEILYEENDWYQVTLIEYSQKVKVNSNTITVDNLN